MAGRFKGFQHSQLCPGTAVETVGAVEAAGRCFMCGNHCHYNHIPDTDQSPDVLTLLVNCMLRLQISGPENDGRTKHMNKVLDHMLRRTVMQNMDLWDLMPSLLEFASNNSWQESIQDAKFR